MDTLLYEEQDHRYLLIGFAESAQESFIPSNQYMICHDDLSVLLDPGGFGLFPVLVSRVLKYTSMENIKAIILSHQDPDVSGGVNIWAELTNAKIYISSLWIRFIPHYDLRNTSNIVSVPDEGMDVAFSSSFLLKILPAHYLHSPGHINVYDPISKILFTGDIGASILPCSQNELFVEDFDTFIPCIEGFHTRYMASNKAVRKWIKDIEKLDVDMIAPQHGYLYKGEAKEKFLRWLHGLKCGVDLL